MKELSDEEFQQILGQQLEPDEKGVPPVNEQDAVIYRALFNALAEEPLDIQNANLANAVINEIKLREQKAEATRYILLITAIVIAGLLFTYFAANYISPAELAAIFKFINIYKWVLLFLVFCFAMIQVADSSLVKKKLAG